MNFIHAVAIDENLRVHLEGHGAIGGELPRQHLQIRSGDAIGITIQGVPGASNVIVDGNVTPCEPSTRVEIRCPWVHCGLHGGDIGFTSTCIGCSRQSNRHPAIEFQVRIDREEQAVDAIGRHCTHGSVAEGCGGRDVGGVDCITGNGTEEVVLVFHGDVGAVGGITRQVCRSKSAHKDADVFIDDFDPEPILAGLRTRIRRLRKQAIAITVVKVRAIEIHGIHTRLIVEGGCHIIIAGSFFGTTRATDVFARAVILYGTLHEVARLLIRTTRRLSDWDTWPVIGGE